MEEVWKDIEGYEGLYQVSNLGNVKSWHTHGGKCGALLNTTLNKDGYCIVTLHKESKHKSYLVHRIVAYLFITNVHNKPHINHIDGNKQNNKINNLEWVTPIENYIHAIKNDLINQSRITRHRGINHHKTKLNEQQVKEIYKLAIHDNIKMVDIAERYNISPSNVKNIKNKITWKHLNLS